MTARKVGALADGYLTAEVEHRTACRESFCDVDRMEAANALADLRALMAECARLRAALDEIAGDLRGRCEHGTTAMHCYNIATRALSEGVKP